MICPTCGNPVDGASCPYCGDVAGRSEPYMSLDLEYGYPSLEEAMIRFRKAIAEARHNKVKVIKVIHGYGSSGSGGVIGREIRRSLLKSKNAGKLRGVAFGEDSEVVKQLLSRYPKAFKDPGIPNPGITFVVL